MKEEYTSAKYEPVFSERDFQSDPSERNAAKLELTQDSLTTVRDSVLNEPAITGDPGQYYLRDWLNEKRSQCSILGNLSFTLLAALVAGPFAVLGAFIGGQGGLLGIAYAIVFAPLVEEFLKQSSMIYLLEKKPYRVFAKWQFVFSAAITALIFATIENLLYINIYVPKDKLLNPEAFAAFRWTVCTAVHICCSIVASLGLIRVWNKQLADGRAADLSESFYYFVIAIVMHGSYNFAAIFLGNVFMVKR